MRLRIAAAGLLVLTALLCCSCAQLGLREEPVTIERPRMELTSGVQYSDRLTGTGTCATVGDLVTVEYTAWLADGTRVDSTLDRGLPVSFTLGAAPLGGWNDGITGMCEGGRRMLIVPAHLAYGEEGVEELVPANSDMHFEIELLRVDAPRD